MPQTTAEQKKVAQKKFAEAYNNLRNCRKSAPLLTEEIEIFLCEILKIMKSHDVILLNNLTNIIQTVHLFLTNPYNPDRQDAYQSVLNNLSDYHLIDPLTNTPTLLSINLAILFLDITFKQHVSYKNEMLCQTAILAVFGSIPNLHARVINQDKQTIIRSMQSLRNPIMFFSQKEPCEEKIYYLVGKPISLYTSTGRLFKQANLRDHLSIDEIMEAFPPYGLGYLKRSKALKEADTPTQMKKGHASPIFQVKRGSESRIYDFKDGTIHILDTKTITPMSATIYFQDPHLGNQIFGPFYFNENAPSQEAITHRDHPIPPKISL